MNRPTNYAVTQHGLTYRVCADAQDRVFFVARKNRKSGEVVLMYGTNRFRQVVKLTEKEHERKFKWGHMFDDRNAGDAGRLGRLLGVRASSGQVAGSQGRFWDQDRF